MHPDTPTPENPPASPAQAQGPSAPPTQPAPIGLPRSVWPTVIGIIAIVFGGFGIIAAMGGTVAALSLPMMWEDPAAAQPWMPALVASNALSLIVSIILLIGGILLVRRRPRAPVVLKAWAWIRIATVMLALALTYVMQREQMAAMAAQPGVMVTGFGLLIMVILGLAWGWALPIFLLIWFSGPRVKAEVATWA